jgi:hypothetical protein
MEKKHGGTNMPHKEMPHPKEHKQMMKGMSTPKMNSSMKSGKKK